MKRLVIITIGKTHSGKSTFAKQLEEKLDNSCNLSIDKAPDVNNKAISN